jgi:hypothetical protein
MWCSYAFKRRGDQLGSVDSRNGDRSDEHSAGDTANSSDAKTWTFLTNHARVLICIARTPQARIRDIADMIGITERATQIIIGDLEESGYLSRSRIGRRNAYTINPDRPFRHPVEADHDVQGLITMFTGHDEAHWSRSAVPTPAAGERRGPIEQ